MNDGVDNTPETYNFGRYLSGDTVGSRELTWDDDRDLTTYTFRMQFRSTPVYNGTLVFDFTPGSGLTVEASKLTIDAFTAPSVLTDTIYYYDLEQTDPDGVVKTILRGNLKVQPDITVAP